MEALFGGFEGCVGAAEFFGLQRLVCKCLCRAHAGKARLHIRVDVPHALFDFARSRAHLPPARQHSYEKYRQQDAHDQRQPPLGAEHDDQGAHNRHKRDEKILRTVVGKLGDFKQVACQAAHELTGAVLVIVVEAQLLHVAEQRFADVRLDADAERVPPVGDDIVEKRPHDIGKDDNCHYGKEGLKRALRQQLIHCPARNKRVGKVNERYNKRADHVEDKKTHVGLEKVQKNLHGGLTLVVFGGHGSTVLVFLRGKAACVRAGNFV